MDFSHIDDKNKAKMVDVSMKDITLRVAEASGFIKIDPDVLKKIVDKEMPKGDVLSVARVAGIMAAKKAGEMIPMCHPIGLDHVQIDFDIETDRIKITATTRVAAKTGVEMEALTAVSVAALTIYDMCKSADKKMVIENIHLVKKTGGRSDYYENR